MSCAENFNFREHVRHRAINSYTGCKQIKDNKNNQHPSNANQGLCNASMQIS